MHGIGITIKNTNFYKKGESNYGDHRQEVQIYSDKPV
jgi:hypothetical protein